MAAAVQQQILAITGLGDRISTATGLLLLGKLASMSYLKDKDAVRLGAV